MKKITNIEDGLVDANNNTSKLMLLLRVVVIGLLVVVLSFAGFITYLQLDVFDTMVAPMTLSDYTSGLDNTLIYTEEGYVVDVPETLIGTLLSEQITLALTDSGYTLENLHYKQATQTAYMNLTYMGFYVPVAVPLQFSKVNDLVTITAFDIALGKSNINGFWPFTSIIKNSEPYKTLNGMEINTATLMLPSGLQFSKFTSDQTAMKAYFTIDKAMVQSVFDQIKSKADKNMVDTFLSSDDRTLVKVGEMVSQVYPLSTEQLVAIANDLRDAQILTTNLLILADNAMTTTVQETLSPFGITIEPDAIAMERKRLEGQQIDPILLALFEGLDNHFVDKTMRINQGRPFDMTAFKTLSVEDVATFGGMDLDETLLNKLSFVYDDGLAIAYALDETTYYVRFKDVYEMIGASEYEQLSGAGDYVVPTLVEDYETYMAVSNYLAEYFQTEKVFVRYMKSDGTSYFVIASPEDEPQLYWSFALMTNGGTYQLLDDNVKSLSDLNDAYPSFNIETGNPLVADTKLPKFADDIVDDVIETILQEMYELGRITHPSNHTIDYISFDGKYIAFMIGTGNEYVYRLDGSHLQTVYTKEKALKNWPDISELILLQTVTE